MINPRIIAFYLPQYHPTPNNDLWWGKGFTEWTNVGKAKPLFRGHEQPKVPADLGYYDLRLSEVREAQAELAKEAGIEGFCYYHYWFGNGHEELDFPLKEVIRSKKPNFPFCLCWANESWHKKFWNIDGTCTKETLAEQIYEDKDGQTKHFYSLLDVFKDPRYIKVDGKLLFMVYRPLEIPNINSFLDLWNSLAKKNGLSGFHFVGHTSFPNAEIDKISQFNLDSIVSVRLMDALTAKYNRTHILGIINLILRRIFRMPFTTDYSKSLKYFITEKEKEHNIFPTIIPNWDHTPRSKRGGYVLKNSTPKLFGKLLKKALDTVSGKPECKRIIFLKAWNEWGEGNYMEPDLKWGKGYIQTMRNCLEDYL